MKKIIAAGAFLIFMNACSKKNSDDICFDGVIKWAGDPAADGLGWVIEEGDSANTTTYVPQELSVGYKKVGLRVEVCLQKTNERVACFCAEPKYKYKVKSISNR